VRNLPKGASLPEKKGAESGIGTSWKAEYPTSCGRNQGAALLS
jgi:hypothetical protein